MTFEEIMSFDAPRNQEVFDELVELIINKKVAPFVGAGLSAFCFPTWRNYLESEFKQYTLEEKIPDGLDYLDAASFLLNTLGEIDFYKDVQKTFGDHNINSANLKFQAAALLPLLFPSFAITTNFDRILEHVYPHAMPVSHPDHESALNAAIMAGAPLIYKMHGCVTEAENIIFTKEAYEDAYKPNTQLVASLKKCFSSFTLLFLGCSLNQDKTMELWQSISEKGMCHYTIMNCAISKKALLNKRKELGNKRFRAILYPDGEYYCLRIILEKLLLSCNPDKYQQNIEKPSDQPGNPFMYNADTVHLHGRDAELKLLENFCLFTDDISWYAICGEGGSGKTRLAYEFQKIMKAKHKWDVHLIRAGNSLSLEKAIEKINNNTLFIIDYVKWITQSIGNCLNYLMDRWDGKGVKIRFLLLEREAIDIDTSVWHREIKLKKFISFSNDVQYKEGMLYLSPLMEGTLKCIVKDYAAYYKKKINADLVIDMLKEIDPDLVRPLFALFLADAAIHGEKLLHWDRNLALNYVCDKELERIRKNIEKEIKGDIETCYQTCLTLIMYATLTNGLDMETVVKINLVNLEDLVSIQKKHHLPKLEMVFDRLAIATREVRKQNSLNNSPTIFQIAPFEPDIVGEYFCQIAPFEPDIVGEYFCIRQIINEKDDVKRLMIKDTAFKIHTNNTGVTYSRICMDYQSLLNELGMSRFFSHIDISSEMLKSDAFSSCNELVSVTLSKDIKQIPSSAFANCEKLTEVIIPEGVKVIEFAAFMYCITLEKVSLPNTLERIDSYAFNNCPALNTIIIPSSIKEIRIGAFDETFDIVSRIPILQQEKVKYLGFCFEHYGEEEAKFLKTYSTSQRVIIPASVSSIDSSAFDKTTNQEIVIHKGIHSIGKDAITGCTSLRRIVIENYKTIIDACAFSYCQYLQEIVIPTRMKELLGLSFKKIGKQEKVFIVDLCRSFSILSFPPNLQKVKSRSIYAQAVINIPTNIEVLENSSIIVLNRCNRCNIIIDGLRKINLKAFYFDDYEFLSGKSRTHVYIGDMNRHIEYEGIFFDIKANNRKRNIVAKKCFGMNTHIYRYPIIGVISFPSRNLVFNDGIKFWIHDRYEHYNNIFFLNNKPISIISYISPGKIKADNVYYVYRLPKHFKAYFQARQVKKITRLKACLLISLNSSGALLKKADKSTNKVWEKLTVREIT